MLPIEAMVARSVGAVTRNRGDLDDGEAVSSLATCTGGAVVAAVDGSGVKGNGTVCEGCREMDDRISMTEEGMKLDVPAMEEPPWTCEVGTDPGGNAAKMYGLTKAPSVSVGMHDKQRYATLTDIFRRGWPVND